MKLDKPITICIIKPDLMAQNKKEEIIEKIVNRGYEIVEERVVKFTPEMAHEFYKHRKDDVGYLRYIFELSKSKLLLFH